MKTIINWTAGSFFRSIGRVIAYIVIGCFIAYILNRSGFDWGRLIGIEKVSALSYTTEVQQVSSGWIDISNINNSNEWTDTYGGYASTISSTSTNNMQVKYIIFNTPLDVSQYDFISIPFNLSQPIRNLETSAIDQIYCQEWGIEQSGDYYCMDGQIDTSHVDIPYTIEISNANFRFQAVYEDGNWNSCDFSNGMIMCPTIHKKISRFEITYLFKTVTSTNLVISVGGGFRVYNYNSSTQAIEQQTQQQQQQYNDTNTSSESNSTTSFFQNQQDETPSALTSAITSPLRIIDNAIQGTHNPLCFTLNSKQTCIPSGDLIWGGTGSNNQHHWFDSGQFNPKVTFINFFNLVVAGYLCYKMLLSMMRIFNNAIDPTVTKIEVMKL